jgi:hypothetical protein
MGGVEIVTDISVNYAFTFSAGSGTSGALNLTGSCYIFSRIKEATST